MQNGEQYLDMWGKSDMFQRWDPLFRESRLRKWDGEVRTQHIYSLMTTGRRWAGRAAPPYLWRSLPVQYCSSCKVRKDPFLAYMALARGAYQHSHQKNHWVPRFHKSSGTWDSFLMEITKHNLGWELTPIFLKLFQKIEVGETLLNSFMRQASTWYHSQKKLLWERKTKNNPFDEHWCKNP